MNALAPAGSVKPPVWKIALALGVVYLCWGTTYLAIAEGVRELPPGLFGGLRLMLAGFIVLVALAWRGESIRLETREGSWLWLVGSFLFLGGNGLVTLAEKTVPSGVASVLIATTPLWMALLELSLPHGERLTGRGWLGLLLGLAGVAVLMSGRTSTAGHDSFDWWGPLLVLGSAFCWAVGSVLYRRRRGTKGHVASAAWQMVLGGSSLALVGLACGEGQSVAALEQVPVRGLLAFLHLLLFGSLLGFVAYVWLLGHVPAAQAGTYAYVNPVVAILIGWLLAGEALTLAVVGAVAVILTGVALVRSAGRGLKNEPAPTAATGTVIEPGERDVYPDRGAKEFSERRCEHADANCIGTNGFAGRPGSGAASRPRPVRG